MKRIAFVLAILFASTALFADTVSQNRAESLAKAGPTSPEDGRKETLPEAEEEKDR